MSKKPTTENPGKPKKMGRIPYDVDELRVKIFYEAPKALKDADLAKFLGISEATYYALKANNSDFLEAVKHYRRISPIEVLNSFKKVACGFEYTEKTRELEKGEDGKRKMVITKEVTKYFAPNAAAGFNYLKNQMSEEFKDKNETHHTFPSRLDKITFIIEST